MVVSREQLTNEMLVILVNELTRYSISDIVKVNLKYFYIKKCILPRNCYRNGDILYGPLTVEYLLFR